MIKKHLTNYTKYDIMITIKKGDNKNDSQNDSLHRIRYRLFFLAIYRAYDNYVYKDMDLAQAVIPNFLTKALLAIVVYFIFL